LKLYQLISATAVFLGASLAISASTLTQCPAANIAGSAYTGCNFLITENADHTFTTTVDTTQPFFGGEDNYAGFQNNTASPVSSLVINGNGTALFGFDGDGPNPTTGGLTGYEGPNTTFSNISADLTTGQVNFTTPIAPGGSAYFFLEDAISASTPPTGGPGGGGGSGVPEPASMSLVGISGLGLAYAAFRRRRS
jgi:PEP-CTERM motif